MAYYLYQIEFPNSKRYIGITNHPVNRYSAHKRNARVGKKTPLCAAIRKYGAGEFKVLVTGDKNYILDLEIKAIALYGTQDRKNGYKVARGGENSPVEGVGHTAATKRKMSKSQSERPRTEEELAHMKRIAQIAASKRQSPEYREKARQVALKRWSNPDHRKKQAEVRAAFPEEKKAAISKGVSERNRARVRDIKFLPETIH